MRTILEEIDRLETEFFSKEVRKAEFIILDVGTYAKLTEEVETSFHQELTSIHGLTIAITHKPDFEGIKII